MSIVLDMHIVTWPPVIPPPFPYGNCLITIIINMMQLYSYQVTNNKLIVLQCGVLGPRDVLTGVLQCGVLCLGDILTGVLQCGVLGLRDVLTGVLQCGVLGLGDVLTGVLYLCFNRTINQSVLTVILTCLYLISC